MFRIWNKALAAAALGRVLPAGRRRPNRRAVALVCDGEFRTQVASIDGSDETMFGGTMHVALVRRGKVSSRCGCNPMRARHACRSRPIMAAARRGRARSRRRGASVPGTSEDRNPRRTRTRRTGCRRPWRSLTIDTTAKQVVLQQTVESGPMMRAGSTASRWCRRARRSRPWRCGSTGRAAISACLEREPGRDHRIPGAIRASKVRLRDEKTYRAVCMPVSASAHSDLLPAPISR